MTTVRSCVYASAWVCSIPLTHAQGPPDWNTAGNVIIGNEYLGAAANSTVPLVLKTVPAKDIQFWVGNTQRAQITSNTSATVNGFTGINQAGYWGLGRNGTTFGAVGPFSRLHVGDYNAPNWDGGFRDYMINGLTLTGNSDHAYIGQRDEGGSHDETTMLFYWSDSLANGTYPNVASFVYGEDYNSGASEGSPTHYSGREIMRLHPSGYLGVGDWRTAAVQPAERLDVLDGNVRIRALSSATDDRLVTATSTGVLHYRPTSDFLKSCIWVMGTGTNPGDNDMYTAAGSEADNCPDETEFVGIGTTTPNAKLHLESSPANPTSGSSFNKALFVKAALTTDCADNRAVDVEAVRTSGTVDRNVGVSSVVSGASNDCAGVYATATGGTETTGGGTFVASGAASETWGVSGHSTGSGTTSAGGGFTADGTAEVNTGVAGIASDAGSINYGSYGTATGEHNNYGATGIATGNGSTNINRGVNGNASGAPNNVGTFGGATGSATTNYGVYGQASGATTNWSGYFVGDVKITNTLTVNSTLYTSDENLKENVEPLEDPLSIVDQLHPMEYNFDTVTYDYMNLPKGHEAGLLAQDLEELLPGLVHDQVYPAQYNEQGAETSPATPYKGIDYTRLIPYLVGAIQQLHAQMDGCCAGMNPGGERALSTSATADLNTERLLISPNPFTDHTTLRYYMPQSARISLQVSDNMGKPVGTLREEQAMAGSFAYEWNTQSLAPGTYFVALVADGNVVVKKAVKVGER